MPEQVSRVVVRFAGDSGDGMQLTGGRFGAESARQGNDIVTLPDFPAEIRAPQGSIGGVSSFQVHFADRDIVTPGEDLDVLVAMNPAALKVHLPSLRRGGVLITDSSEYTKRNLNHAGYAVSPLDDGSLEASYQLVRLDLNSVTGDAVAPFGLGRKAVSRARNMFALGLASWLYSRDMTPTREWLQQKFAAQPEVRDANLAALEGGWNYGENTETFAVRYEVASIFQAPGRYRQISGSQATALGLLAASVASGLQLFLGAYPITPASDLLHELSKRKAFGVQTFQAEDEIAAVGAALGASFGGALGVTTTSGPGLALKQEMINLAVMTELPLVIIDVQRAGPSTGMPTKTEQADLLQAMWGRNGESPVPVIAPSSPADCFSAAFEACRIALTHRTPVIMLSDAYLANGSEPWLVPDAGSLPTIDPGFATEANTEQGTFAPYHRDPLTLDRPWAIPGTPGLEHRIGGLEKSNGLGTISYDGDNHDTMVKLRAEHIARIAVPEATWDDPSGVAKLAVLGWGSTWGAITAAVRRVRELGVPIAQIHVRNLNPLPANLGQLLHRADRVIVPEVNLGQFAMIVRAKYLVDARSWSRMRGLPLGVSELTEYLLSQVEEVQHV
ncbi:2-oxoacid:acceptor oxidoreductase subunit alpha [Brooklawnia propionicigenes]|uniref:2-oxoacid:acceptor oxidoreductase subunit alpha n=1 Tax=Brooklawnia propionicigenes TaxID=3041175 RepID=UPI002573C0B5|nr:2-oxoacid:acceptor oxidoreductase subunit alpha [Brooklawnia sp. SH051]